MAPNNMMGMNNMQYQQQMGMMNMPQQVEDLFYTELMVWEKYVDISFYTQLTINLWKTFKKKPQKQSMTLWLFNFKHNYNKIMMSIH